MVLERLVSVKDAVKNPSWMFIIGGVVAVISSFISFLVFPENIGMFTTIFITFAMTPFMVNLVSYEEATTEQEISRRLKMNFFQRHTDILMIYIAFFSGMVFALSLLFILLPGNTVEKLFESQINEINLIRGSALFPGPLTKILVNNIGVLFISFLFAFLFGSGAIFILSWNASVLAAAIGLTAKSIGGLKGVPTAMLTFLPHGVPEMIAYFIAGIAGGMVSAVIIRKKSSWFLVVVRDSLKMVGVALFLLLVAAFIEYAIITY